MNSMVAFAFGNRQKMANRAKDKRDLFMVNFGCISLLDYKKGIGDTSTYKLSD